MAKKVKKKVQKPKKIAKSTVKKVKAQRNGNVIKKADVKKFQRSKTDKILCGVCGGIGKYFGIDPIIIRLLWVLLTLVTFGLGVIGYVLLWLVIPQEK